MLPNGMRLVLLENREVPTVTLSARVAAGSFQETDPQAGLANLTARLLEEGTRTRSHEQVSAALEQVGASFGAAAGRTATVVRLDALSEHVSGLLSLYAELLREPAFPSDRLEQERSRLLVELKEAEDDAAVVARNAFYDLVYGTHPAHRPITGTEKTVRGLDRQALADFHARHYRPERTTLVAVGDFRSSELLQQLTTAFSGWEKGQAAPSVAFPKLERQKKGRVRRIPLDKTQTRVVLGHLGITRANRDYLALKVMDAILGDSGSGFTARIPYQVRDIQGLVYGVASMIARSAEHEPGVFVAALGTEPAKENRAVQAVLKEIRRIRTEPVTEKELREAINYLASGYVFEFQTNEQLAAYLHEVLDYGLGYDYRRQLVRDLHKVTRADILRVAQKYLDPEHLTMVVVGPAKEATPTPKR